MPLLGFLDGSFTIVQEGYVATLAQPMTLTPTLSKRIDTYVFRDKTTTSVDAGKEADRLQLTGLDFLTTSGGLFPYSFPFEFQGSSPMSMMQQIDAMMDSGHLVYVENLGFIESLDPGYNGWYYITSFSYERRAGCPGRYYYEMTLENES